MGRAFLHTLDIAASLSGGPAILRKESRRCRECTTKKSAHAAVLRCRRSGRRARYVPNVHILLAPVVGHGHSMANIMWLVSQHGLAGCVWPNPRRPQKTSKTRAQGSSAAIRQHRAILEALRLFVLFVYAVWRPRGQRKKPSTNSSRLMYRTSTVQLCDQSSATRAKLGAKQLRAQ